MRHVAVAIVSNSNGQSHFFYIVDEYVAHRLEE